MDDIFLVKEGKIIRYDGTTLHGKQITKDELVETFGYKALEEIEQFGAYQINK
ncbi:MAG: hypothetical protein K0R57_689 [Paenibacillaceae bacterium]|jgi:hypothetical protein|nr:hypothetical protein [Paenibacillaceae bacterium]